MNSGSCHPSSSSSGLLGNLEEKMTKNFDKMGEKLRRKLLHKDKEQIFVPSSSASNGSPENSFSRSSSHVEPSLNHLSPNPIDHRRQSSPAPLVRGPALMPQPILNQPPQIGFLALSIDTYGGETAGSGYDHWLQEDAQLQEEEEKSNSSYIKAQELARNMVLDEISRKEEMARAIKQDNQMLNDFIASTFSQQLVNPDRTNTERLTAQIEELKTEIANLRTLSPRSVPPERPPRPNAAVLWTCPRCTEHCSLHEYRCKVCKLPRAEIDLNEITNCSCPECLKIREQRLLVSVSPGDGDWLVVNRLNHL